jgi:hypothetical protein
LPDKTLKLDFVESLAELEDNAAHRSRIFPKTRLHKIKGTDMAIYRGDIDKISGWRIHVQYENNRLHLKDIIDGQSHDDVQRAIKSKRYRYNK